ncbi:hypothetical protein [Paenibacillus zanthoxyli]|uniref:hypothetical protein n=1 Tax=Paenibacillus zanthoxyli TaxID=369399 RepID=UPI0004718C6A|nr:hypothetical protein [Paenibacillus zanthoxyli]
MIIYENQFQANNFNILPGDVHQHIIGIIEASPTSQFYCHVQEEIPNVYVYLIENNQLEKYSVCHFFSCDQIGREYLYQSLPLEQIRFFSMFASLINIT